MERLATNLQSHLRSVQDWENWYSDQVSLGPSAIEHGVNHLCYEAYQRGLTRTYGDKRDLIATMAEIKFHIQPNGLPPKTREKLDLEQIAKESSRPIEKVNLILGLMDKHGLI